MAFSRAAHVIHTRGDGALASTTTADVDAIARAMSQSSRVVLHFHGGLVSEDAGFSGAERLYPTYDAAGAYPVFFVWRSGIGETVTGNIAEILTEGLFKRLLAKLLRYAVGKVNQTGGDRAAGTVPAPEEMAVNRELVRRRRDEEPYDQVAVARDVTELTDLERAQLETEVAEDPAIQDELAAALAWRTGTTGTGAGAGARGVYVVAPQPTRISPDVLDELAARDDGARGVGAALFLAKKVGETLFHVVRRFRAGTDHDVYPTVVEELMRALYLADLGGVLWHAMKKDTLDTFADADPRRGGSYLLDRLASELHGAGPRGGGPRGGGPRGGGPHGAGRPLPEITLVGHSTGAVFIDHLIGAVDRRRAELPDGFGFANVAFLAPACTHEHFARALVAADLVGRFRMFTMTDPAERANRLVGALYPRSLLHLIAGVLERDSGGGSAYRCVTGMARFLDGDGEPDAGIAAVRRYLAADPARVVRSPSNAGAAAGQRAGATTHESFDEDRLVLASLAAMIQGGS